MKSGFLNTKSSAEKGVLKDDRSRPLYGGDISSGGWERSKEKSTRDQHSHQPSTKPTFSFVDCPILPLSLGNPKNALSVWYGRRHKDFTFCVNDCFVSWDFGLAHEKYFTSIFTCPASQEKFMSGMLKSKPKKAKVILEKAKEGMQVEIVWYKKKKEAEHAAAARALDCLSYREGMGKRNMCYGLCDENPYMKDTFEFHMPISAPDEVEDEVMTQPIDITNKARDLSMDEDASQFRSDYRSNRQSDAA